MDVPTDSHFRVKLTQVDGLGSPWIVRVYKKGILFKKLVSSDWFLDGEQAKQFAGQAAAELSKGDAYTNLADRAPGWTLHRPKR